MISARVCHAALITNPCGIGYFSPRQCGFSMMPRMLPNGSTTAPLTQPSPRTVGGSNGVAPYLATLHEQGHLLAAGPLGHDGFRGLSILRGTVDEVRTLKEADPAVVAGRFSVVVIPWQVPAGAVHFTPTRFPHSIADAEGD